MLTYKTLNKVIFALFNKLLKLHFLPNPIRIVFILKLVESITFLTFVGNK